jgi:O-methyltransferase domain/Dimerisation domain
MSRKAVSTDAPVDASTGAGSTAPSRLVDIVFGAMAAKVLYAAAELRLADLLAEGVRTSEELAERTGTHGPSLRRLLRALAGMGCVTQTGPERFELAQLGQQLRADAPGSVRELVRMRLGPEFWRSWDELVASVRTGETGWVRTHGMPPYQFYERHPERSATFNAAMAQQTRAVAPAVIAAYDFSRFATVVDVGGGDGTLLAELLRAHPDLRGVLFDLPAGLAGAAGTLTAAGVADRCQVVPGDFFASVPEGGDAYAMKQVLHNWDDDRAVAVLRNCHRAMASTARLVVLERVLPDLVGVDDRQLEALLLDGQMLVVTGGRERTEQEFRSLLDAAGFTLTALTEPLPPYGYRVIEGTPA